MRAHPPLHATGRAALLTALAACAAAPPPGSRAPVASATAAEPTRVAPLVAPAAPGPTTTAARDASTAAPDASPAAPAVPAFGRVARVQTNAGYVALLFDDAGRVAWRVPGGDPVPLPFTEPVLDADIEPLAAHPNVALVCAVLRSGALECYRHAYDRAQGAQRIALGGGGALAAVWLSGAAPCVLPDAPAPAPMHCAQALMSSSSPRPYTVQPSLPLARGAFGPVRFRALRRVEGALLEAARRAGLSLEAPDAVQVDGAEALGDAFRADHVARHVCAVLADRTVACWGTRSFGELGDGTAGPGLRRARVAGLTDVAEVAVGGRHACARVRDGRVACWGSTASDPFPVPATAPRRRWPRCNEDRAASARANAAARREAERRFRACIQRVCAPGTLDCHLGCSPTPSEVITVFDRSRLCEDPEQSANAPFLDRPAFLDGVHDAVSIAAAGAQTCLVRASGEVQCWGSVR